MHKKAFEVHKIASVTTPLGLSRRLTVAPVRRHTHDGDVVVVRAEAEKRVYGEIELAGGRMAKIFRGDLIVGALGTRRALKGYVGARPESAGPGDRLALLNLGGVLGVPEGTEHPDLGPPCPVRVEGFVLTGENRVASVSTVKLPPHTAVSFPPVVVVSGTSMACGKTRAACEIIHELAAGGMRIHAGKLTGIACLRDLFAMSDHGARRTLSFLDCGLVSTVGVPDMATVARALLSHLASGDPEALVVELGDGILGEYGVLAVLKELRDSVAAHVVCATDPVSAWGACRFLSEEGVPVHVLSGPCTDSVVGTRFAEQKLRLPAANACFAPQKLAALVRDQLERES